MTYGFDFDQLEYEKLLEACKGCRMKGAGVSECEGFYSAVQILGTGNTERKCWHPKGTFFVYGEKKEDG